MPPDYYALRQYQTDSAVALCLSVPGLLCQHAFSQYQAPRHDMTLHTPSAPAPGISHYKLVLRDCYWLRQFLGTASTAQIAGSPGACAGP
eukprot:2170704-Rhodomonas_salina.2